MGPPERLDHRIKGIQSKDRGSLFFVTLNLSLPLVPSLLRLSPPLGQRSQPSYRPGVLIQLHSFHTHIPTHNALFIHHTRSVLGCSVSEPHAHAPSTSLRPPKWTGCHRAQVSFGPSSRKGTSAPHLTFFVPPLVINSRPSPPIPHAPTAKMHVSMTNLRSA